MSAGGRRFRTLRMFETLLLGALVVLLPAGLLLVLAVVELRRRLRTTELRVLELERRVGAAPGAPAQAHPTEARDSESVPVESVVGVRPPVPDSAPATPAAAPSTVEPPSVRPAAPPAAEPEPVQPAQAPARETNWEHWLGARGAGWLGGAVGALASILLFVHAAQEGWITPNLRVASGAAFGVLGALGSEWLHRRRYAAASDGLLGAAATAWFAAAWAASERYGFLPTPVSFGVMVTGVAWCVGVAWRRRSSVAALLILLGGFGTPLLLGDGSDQRWSLFGYLLVLDAVAILTAHVLRRGWVSSMAFAATTAMQFLWVHQYAGPEDGAFTTGLALAFGLLFAWTVTGQAAQGGRSIQSLTAAVPLGLLVAIGVTSDVQFNLWWLAGAVWLLQGAARGLAERTRAPWLVSLSAFASVLLFAVAVFGEGAAPARSPIALAAVVLAVGAGACVRPAYLLPTRHERRAAGLGVLGAVFVGCVANGRVWVDQSALGVAADVPVVLALLAVAIRAARLPLGPPFGTLLAFAFGALVFTQRFSPADGWTTVAKPLIGIGTALVGVACTARLARTRLRVDLAAVVDAVALVALFHWGLRGVAVLNIHDAPSTLLHAWAFGAVLVVIAAVATLGSARSPRPLVGGLPLLAAALVAATSLATPVEAGDGSGWLALLLPMATVFGALILLPQVVARRPVATSVGAIGVLVAQVGVFACTVVLRDPGQLGQRSAAALGALAIVIPAGLAHGIAERRTTGARSSMPSLALVFAAALGAAAALPGLFGLVYFSAGLLGIVLFELGQSRPGRRRVGQVCAAALVCVSTAFVFADGMLEAKGTYPINELGLATLLLAVAGPGFALVSGRHQPSPGVQSAGLITLWNAVSIGALAVFADLDWLDTPLTADGAAGLALSLSWACLALGLLVTGLLVTGLSRSAGGLRRASLILLMVTLTKVFLIDLGDLEGLARVASLGGLAVSLTIVSIAYQRLVVGARAGQAPAG